MSNESKKVKVSTTADLQQALAAGHDASQIEIDHTAALAAAKAEGVTEGKASAGPDVAAASENAAKAERKRVLEIQGLARAGFDAEVKAAIEAGDSPEKFAMSMLKAAQDRGITIDAIRKDAPKAAPHANPKDTDPGAAKPWDQVTATAPKRM